MIINIRGTSGSGKSHLVRSVMDLYGLRTKFFVENRKQPIGYTAHRRTSGRNLSVLGHYETACGGCDTIPSLDQIFSRAMKAHGEHDVLFEGLIEIGRAHV